MVRTPRCGRGNPGSNPGWGISGLGLVGYDARLTRERSRVRPSELVLHGTLAEWLRRMIRNHMGVARVGSSPTRVVLRLAECTLYFKGLYLLLLASNNSTFGRVV